VAETSPEAVKKSIEKPNSLIPQSGTKPQRFAKEFEFAFLCALVPLRQTVDFFTAIVVSAASAIPRAGPDMTEMKWQPK